MSEKTPKENKEESKCSCGRYEPENKKELHTPEYCFRIAPPAPQTPDSMDWEKEFFDFYFERGKYSGRALGPHEYVKFIKDLLTLAHSSGRREGIEEAITKTGFLRQWLNERTETRLVTDEDLQTFLKIGVKSLLDKDLT